MDLLVNIDVPDLDGGVAFYTEAFGLRLARRLGGDAVEMSGWPVKLYLLRRAPGSRAAGRELRRYDRHWTPVHLDVVVDDIDTARRRALAAGASAETEVQEEAWGRIAVLADPFGHGLCLIEFSGRGYDEIATGDS